MLDFLLENAVFSFILLFTRLGTAFLVAPGLGNTAMPARVRLLFAAAFTLVLVPVLSARLPAPPDKVLMLGELVVLEAVVGGFLGMVVRMIFAALEIAGTVMASHMGLANAFLFNPQMQSQMTLPGVLLVNIGVVLFFVTGMHHMFLRALVESYHLFPPGEMIATGDMALTGARLLADSFRIAVQMAAPFMLVGLLFFLGLGLLSRLMPQLQVFFVALPAQLLIGAILIALTLSATVMVWLSYADARMAGILTG